MGDELSLKLVIDAQNRAANELKKLNQQISNVNKSAQQTASGGFSRMGGAMKVAAGAALGVGAAFVGAGALIGKTAISSAMNLEQTRVAFEVMIGDANKAKQTMADLSQFAAKTPFELPELQNAGKSLLAFGVASENLVPTLGKIGDVSSGLNIPIGELSELYGKAKVQGRLFMEDINQLTGRGVPINEQLAKQFGVTQDKVRGMVEEGKIGFPQLEQAFVDMTGPGGQFFGMMDKQSQTVAGRISTLKDGFSALTKNIIGIDPEGNIKEGGIFDQFSKSISAAGAFLEKHDEQIMAFTNGALKALIAYGGFVINNWKIIFEWVKKGAEQWKNYEGIIGIARKAIEQIVGVFREQFIQAWQELRAAIAPHIPMIINVAKIIGGTLLVAMGALAVGIASVVLGAMKFITFMIKAGETAWGFAKTVGNAIAFVVGKYVELEVQIITKIGDLIGKALEWGTHMMQNFGQGITNALGNVTQPVENMVGWIKGKIGFSKNPNIPTEVWGAHMMQNFASGIDLGNKDVKAKLNETVKHVKDRIEDFTKGFADMGKKASKAWDKFKDSIKDARKTYKDNIAKIKEDIESIHTSMKETRAAFKKEAQGIKDDYAKNSGAATMGMGFDIAGSIFESQERQAKAQRELQNEMAKDEKDRDKEKIAGLEAQVSTEAGFLAKHLADQQTYAAQIIEVRRKAGLDEIELRKEQHAQEQADLITKRDEQLAQAKIEYDEKMAKYAQELVDLQAQKDKEADIYQKAADKARNILKASLDAQKKDAKNLVNDLVKEFERIPDSISQAFTNLGKKMMTAGSTISGGKGSSKTTNNSKNFSVIINSGGGESQKDLLNRLNILLKTL